MMPNSPLPHLAAVAAVSLLALAGCGASVPANLRPVRPSNLGAAGEVALPMLLEFHEGDRIPIDVDIGGDLVRTEAGAPPVLVVKQRFFLYLGREGAPRISLDGKTFGGVKGSFMLGVGVKKGEEPKGTFRVSVVKRD